MSIQTAPVDKQRLTVLLRGRIEDALTAAPKINQSTFQVVRDLVWQAHIAAEQVGTAPPQPPTLRARIGAALVQMVRRMLFWYTPQIRDFQVPTAQAMTIQAELLQQFAEETTRTSDALRREQRKLVAQLADLQEQNRALRAALDDTSQAVQRMLAYKPQLGQADLDRLYVAFEDEFRGAREVIAQRLSVYLPMIQEAQAGTGERPVLDVGCGRGEWLRILREAHLTARGVDSNKVMVEECVREGLDALQGDFLRYLQELPPASVGAVTAFHIVEHLPFETMVEGLDQILRVLRPGGIAIFETPNPENILVGAKNFYHDPTHRNPIPPKTLEFFVRTRGFSQVQVLPLNACEPGVRVEEDGPAVARRFNEYFYGPQDYAVIGRKD